MTGYTKRDPRSNEAALKYLLIGASSSCLPVWVSLCSTGCRGQTQLNAIAAGIANANAGQSLGLVIALVFVVAGVGFKISAAPFHQWTPDVYEGAHTIIAFLSVRFSSWVCSNPSDDNSLSLDYRRVAVCLHRSRRFEYGVGCRSELV